MSSLGRLALLVQIPASEKDKNVHKCRFSRTPPPAFAKRAQLLTCLSALPEVGLSFFRENVPLPDREAAGVTIDAAPDPAGVDLKRVRERVNRAETRRDLEPARISNRWVWSSLGCPATPLPTILDRNPTSELEEAVDCVYRLPANRRWEPGICHTVVTTVFDRLMFPCSFHVK